MATGDVRPAGQGGVTAAGVLLIVLGSLTLLVNGAGLLITLAEDEFLGLEGGPLLLGLTGFGVLLGVATIASGIGVLRRKGAWRVVGIVAAAVGALSALINLIGGAGVPIAVILLIAWIWAIVLLARSGEAFRPAGVPGALGPAATMAGGLAVGAHPAAGPLGAILAFAGAALVILALFIPVVGDFRLFAPGVPIEFWLWALLQPLGLAATAVVVAIPGLSSGDRLKAGILIGLGSVGFLFFATYLLIIATGAPLGLGTLLGLAGTGLIAGGGIAMAARSGEPLGAGGPLGAILALVGAGALLVAWVLPLTGGFGSPFGIPLGGGYLQQTLDILGAIFVGGIPAAIGLSGRGRRLTGGMSLGAGVLAALIYVGSIGFDLGQGRFSLVPVLGLVGGALLLAGGAVSAAGRPRAATPAVPGHAFGAPPAPPPAPPATSPPGAPPATPPPT